MNELKPKVYVGMSGGVDSSVSAALLRQQGFDVTGVFIRVWQPEWLEEQGGCTWREDRLDAMRVCVHLGIPFVTLDLEREYKREVVDYMIAEYQAGRTPNPDVMCNRYVKFGGFFDWAMKQGADYVATGHYAQIREEKRVESKEHGGRKEYRLVAGKDQGKDQSYFLWTLTQRELSRTFFPVGGMDKSETRRLARKFGLPVAEKRDSQGLCFIGKVDIKEFLSHYIERERGDAIDGHGKVVGRHDGAMFVTLGERIAVEGAAKGASEKPYFVIAKDLGANTVTVSHKAPDGSLPVEKREYQVGSANWILGAGFRLDSGRTYTARIRHLGELLPCRVKADGKVVEMIFEKPLIVAPGQSVVVYDGDVCVGGGIIV